jgi:DnaJ domain
LIFDGAVEQTETACEAAHRTDSVRWIDPVFVKAKQDGGRTLFFLCIAERGGTDEIDGKTVEYSVCLGHTLSLNAGEWGEILRNSSTFRSVALSEVLNAAEKYAAVHGLHPETLMGLREAARGGKRAAAAGASERRFPEDERMRALHVLGLLPGAAAAEIESAFRKAARRHHPDTGGDPATFRAILNARNFLLGREPRDGELA